VYADRNGELELLSLNSIVKHSDDIFWQDVVDDVVILSIEKAQYFGSESTGATIWRFLEAPTSIASICEKLMTQFEIDRGVCEAEVLDFIAQLRAAALIEVISE
jgi:hypothetical protein